MSKTSVKTNAVATITLTINRDGTVGYAIQSTNTDVLAAYGKRLTGETKAKGIARGVQIAAGIERPDSDE